MDDASLVSEVLSWGAGASFGRPIPESLPYDSFDRVAVSGDGYIKRNRCAVSIVADRWLDHRIAKPRKSTIKSLHHERLSPIGFSPSGL